MMSIRMSLAIFVVLLPCASWAQEHGRIKWKHPTPAEAERMASEWAMNDGILRRGDIVVTDRGFLVFQGLSADGTSGEFTPIPNPMLKAPGK